MNPYLLTASSNKTIYLKCDKICYHGTYKTTCNSFYAGKRCPYCVGKKVHKKDSFGTFHIGETDIDFIHKYWSSANTVDLFAIAPQSHKKIFMKCVQKQCHPDYEVSASKFTAGKRCPYCSHQKIVSSETAAITHPLTIELWSDKNASTPFEYYSSSGKKVWWKCENGLHDDYLRDFNNSTKRGFMCPKCVILRKTSAL